LKPLAQFLPKSLRNDQIGTLFAEFFTLFTEVISAPLAQDRSIQIVVIFFG